MQKIILKVYVDNKFLKMLGVGNIFDKVEYIEGRSILKIDFDRMLKLVVADIALKDGWTLDDVFNAKGWNTKVLDILQKNGNCYTVLLKAEAGTRMQRTLFKMFDIDIIPALPYYFKNGELTMAFISDSRNIEHAVKVLGRMGAIRDIKIQKFYGAENNMLAVLTERQKEILLKAKHLGYFEVPRKATIEDISREMGLSKATVSEHLQKGLRRLINSVLYGY